MGPWGEPPEDEVSGTEGEFSAAAVTRRVRMVVGVGVKRRGRMLRMMVGRSMVEMEGLGCGGLKCFGRDFEVCC